MNKFVKILLSVTLVLIVSVVLVVVLQKQLKSSTKPNNYQAVFLSNGQVLFGRLDYQNPVSHLNSVYYITGTSTPQLIKMGSEQYSPVGQMNINSLDILYYQDISSTGAVSKAITNTK